MTIKTTTNFCSTDRYVYDFSVCTYEKGWAQIDTRQDASYYGTWTNPERRRGALWHADARRKFYVSGDDDRRAGQQRQPELHVGGYLPHNFARLC